MDTVESQGIRRLLEKHGDWVPILRTQGKAIKNSMGLATPAYNKVETEEPLSKPASYTNLICRL